MKSIRLFLLAFLTFVSISLLAQVSPYSKDYQPLVSANPLPAIVTTKSSKKFKKDLERIDKKDRRKVRKTQKKFFLESNFVIDGLLKSGAVLYNDPVSKYVKEVADQVLKNQPDLKENIQVFVLRSPEVNAFTTDQGYVFVTLGLLARLETEAQLAFILGHEFIHYQNEHSLNFTLIGKRSKKNLQGSVYPKKEDERELFRYTFAKEQETEADKEGLELFLASDYGTGSLDQCFDILGKGYLPFEDEVFDISFFESENLKLPESFILNKIDQIMPLDITLDDERSTHPNTAKRQKVTLETVNKKGKPQGNDFLVSAERFADAKERARFEVCHLHLDNQEYFSAIYASYILLKKYPENLYLKKTLVSSMRSLAKYKNNYYAERTMVDSIEGGSQPLLYFLQKIRPKDFNMIAAAHAWNLYEQYPEDLMIKKTAEDLLPQLIAHHDFHLKDIKKNYTQPKGYNSESFKKKLIKVRSAYETNKASSTEKEITPLGIPFKIDSENDQKLTGKQLDSLNSDAVLAPFLNNEAFIAAWEQAEITVEKSKKKSNGSLTYLEKRQFKKKGFALNQDRILVISPKFIQGNFQNQNKYKLHYIRSEKGYDKLKKSIKTNAKANNVEAILLDSDNLKTDDQEKLNELATLYSWLNSKSNFSKLDDKLIGTNFYQTKVDEIAKKYNVKYILFVGSVTSRNNTRVMAGLTQIIFVYYTIRGIKTLTNGLSDHYIFGTVMDIETGESFDVLDESFKSTNEKHVTDLYLYDLFNQIKSKR